MGSTITLDGEALAIFELLFCGVIGVKKTEFRLIYFWELL